MFASLRKVNDCTNIENPPNEIKHVETINFRRSLVVEVISASPLVISISPLEMPFAKNGSIFVVVKTFSRNEETNPNIFTS